MAKDHAQETIIAQGVRVEGDFHSEGDVLIDGEVNGQVRTAGALRVGETAQIQADVQAHSAVISGTVHGNMLVEERLELTKTSHVQGDIQTKIIIVAEGAQVNGSVRMGDVSMPASADEELDEEASS